MEQENNFSNNLTSQTNAQASSPVPPAETPTFSSEPTVTPSTPSSPKKKVLIVGAAVACLLLIGSGVFLFLNKKETSSEPTVKTYSGYTLEDLGLDETASEEEINARVSEVLREEDRLEFTSLLSEDSLAVFRANSFFEGYAKESVDMLDDTISNFFQETYPEYKTIDFVKDSLKDDSFELLSDSGVKYTVKLTTTSSDSGKSISYVSIFDASGQEILGYDGRFYEGTKLIIEDNGELFGESSDEAGKSSSVEYSEILDENGENIFKNDK